ncbi:hypothetical protein L249_6758 [Ophiocordyceps polyrhachis-furcata BCC 54312]|uniref:Uncharacterized protein n=1 Tax=Ophiocordyceps polyrhachis-furcata BCC 54312 TaxID=1330021 RepID=A0A367LLQ5_9HYPO|nr:hypothetical protein L249_6758 [Ophiocordyceps polyrhachis-furcata BCC 54312]
MRTSLHSQPTPPRLGARQPPHAAASTTSTARLGVARTGTGIGQAFYQTSTRPIPEGLAAGKRMPAAPKSSIVSLPTLSAPLVPETESQPASERYGVPSWTVSTNKRWMSIVPGVILSRTIAPFPIPPSPDGMQCVPVALRTDDDDSNNSPDKLVLPPLPWGWLCHRVIDGID